MDGGAEGVQHLHLLQHVLPAGGADDEQLPTLNGEDMGSSSVNDLTWAHRSIRFAD